MNWAEAVEAWSRVYYSHFKWFVSKMLKTVNPDEKYIGSNK